jgi:hypothetical protein
MIKHQKQARSYDSSLKSNGTLYLESIVSIVQRDRYDRFMSIGILNFEDDEGIQADICWCQSIGYKEALQLGLQELAVMLR